MEPLEISEIKKLLNKLPNWTFKNDKIGKEYVFQSFKEALAFIVRVGLEAESMQHHPELFNVYNTVKIELSTHDAGNKVTQKDIDLATSIENI